MEDENKTENFDKLIDILIEMESEGDVNVIGDFGKAYGILQIHQVCLDDVNKWFGTSYVVEDMLGETGAKISRWVFKEYIRHYATEKRLGRKVSDVDRARIWNGGPDGWNKSATRGYGAKFTKLFEQRFNE